MRAARWLAAVVLCAPGGASAADRYGDPLPPGAVARLGTVKLRARWKLLAGGLFDRDPRRLLALDQASYVQPARLVTWDLQTGRKHAGPVIEAAGVGLTSLVAVWPDGRHVLLSLYEGGLVLVNRRTGATVEHYPLAGPLCYSAKVDAEGRRIAAKTDRGLELIDLRKGRSRQLLKGAGLGPFAFSLEDRSLLAVVELEEGGHAVVDAVSGKARKRLPTGPSEWALSPDGRHLAAWDGEGVVLHDLRRSRTRAVALGRGAEANMTLCFREDGRQLLVTFPESGQAAVVDTGTARAVRRLQVRESLWSAWLSPDGQAVGGADEEERLRV
jgi:hypothetical protein